MKSQKNSYANKTVEKHSKGNDIKERKYAKK